MSGRRVCDASALAALLVDDGPAGRWATEALVGSDLVAPHHVMFETANVLRRHELAGLIDLGQAAQAHADLVDLPMELWPYEPLAARAWELRRNLTIYDACYVAVAEMTDATLVTLDVRIAAAPGLRCTVAVP